MAELADRKKLIEYLPDFMKNFSEIKELMRVANVESDEIYSRIGGVIDEAFIEDCTEYGLSKYEKQMGIISNPDEDMAIRKNRVKAYWCRDKQYSFGQLIRNVNILLGGSWNYDMSCDLEHYALTFNIYEDKYVHVLDGFLGTVLPENMFYTIHVAKDWAADNFICCVWQDDEILEWR